MIATPRVRRNSHNRHHQDSERTEGPNWVKSLIKVSLTSCTSLRDNDKYLHFRQLVFLVTTYGVDFEYVKFMFSKKATKIDELFTFGLTSCSKCQIDSEDFVDFCGLFIKHELYIQCGPSMTS